MGRGLLPQGEGFVAGTAHARQERAAPVPAAAWGRGPGCARVRPTRADAPRSLNLSPLGQSPPPWRPRRHCGSSATTLGSPRWPARPGATHLEEDAADAAEQLRLLLREVLDDGEVRVHGQHVVLRGEGVRRARRTAPGAPCPSPPQTPQRAFLAVSFYISSSSKLEPE